jgi:ATP adenylyltransferase
MDRKKIKKVVDPRFSGGRGDYAAVIRAIQKEGHCPFCPENFKYHRKPILKRHGSWFITRASWPYKNTQHHFILLGTKHKEQFHELKNTDWAHITWLIRWTIKKYNIKGGGMALRFGETTYTGATVCHLHAHLIVPVIDKKKNRAKTVRFPIG